MNLFSRIHARLLLKFVQWRISIYDEEIIEQSQKLAVLHDYRLHLESADLQLRARLMVSSK